MTSGAEPMEIIDGRGESLTRQVHRVLQRAIIVGNMEPGSLHSVAKIADRLQVSRSPVREALITLADQGMVAFERNRGVRVLQTTVHDLEEVISLRLLLEVPAAYRAAQLGTPEDTERLRAALGRREDFAASETMLTHQELDAAFHRVVLQSAGNRRLVGIVDNLWSHQKLRGLSAVSHTRQLTDIYDEHLAILERVAAHDAEGAATAMRHHLTRSARFLVAQQTGGPADDLDDDSLPWFQASAGVFGLS